MHLLIRYITYPGRHRFYTKGGNFLLSHFEPDEYESWIAQQQAGGAAAQDTSTVADTADDVDEVDAESGTGAPPGEETGSGDASPGTDAAASDGVQLEIGTTAEKSIGYTTASLEAKAGQPVTVTYTNDSKIPHDIAFYEGPDGESAVIVESETITGPGAM